MDFHQLSKLLLSIVEGAKDLIISDDMIAAAAVAMKLAKGYDDCSRLTTKPSFVASMNMAKSRASGQVIVYDGEPINECIAGKVE